MAQGLKDQGFVFFTPVQSNQIFPVFSNARIRELQKFYIFQRWEAVDADHSAIRLVTSWATREENVEAFLEDVRKSVGK
jgi:threonine aldolase